jgi:hypothetical protein
MKRTGAIVILAIISVVAGLVAVSDTVRYLMWATSEFDFFGSPWLGAILSGLVALIWFATARQVWNGDPRGWLFVVSISVIFLIFDIISLISGTPWEYLSAQIMISVLALILALLPSTKREFGQAAQ